jgi:hypothetical protein
VCAEAIPPESSGPGNLSTNFSLEPPESSPETARKWQAAQRSSSLSPGVIEQREE